MQMEKTQRTYRRDTSLMESFTISQLANLTGINAKAIRYYESIGLLPYPQRSDNGYRRYSMDDVNRLILLRRVRLLGVPLSSVKPLLGGASDARCIDVQRELLTLVRQRLGALDQEIAELQVLRREVESYQRALADRQPDEDAAFSMCIDMSCLAFSRDTDCCKESYDGNN